MLLPKSLNFHFRNWIVIKAQFSLQKILKNTLFMFFSSTHRIHFLTHELQYFFDATVFFFQTKHTLSLEVKWLTMSENIALSYAKIRIHGFIVWYPISYNMWW